MKIAIVKDGEVLKPESGKLPDSLPQRFTIEISGGTGRIVRQSRGTRKAGRKTKHGRTIHEEADFAKRECPYPFESGTHTDRVIELWTDVFPPGCGALMEEFLKQKGKNGSQRR